MQIKHIYKWVEHYYNLTLFCQFENLFRETDDFFMGLLLYSSFRSSSGWIFLIGLAKQSAM